jgi:hypothetical protein
LMNGCFYRICCSLCFSQPAVNYKSVKGITKADFIIFFLLMLNLKL